MKRGKDDEKIMGPMFPRLHVNDTEKGGPRAPPRNKMALYEQLSIPSQRFNHGVLPLNPNNSASVVPPASSSQGSGHERGQEHRDRLANNFDRIPSTGTSLNHESRARAQLQNSMCGIDVSNEPARRENGFSSILRRDSCPEELRSPITNGSGYHVDKTRWSVQAGKGERGGDASVTSMVGSISGMDISPDDVVGIIGQKHFWESEKSNSQVQRSIAGSPHLLLEDGAYLGEPLKASSAKKLPLEYIVKPSPQIAKHKDDSDNPNRNMECSAENAVGKTSLSSAQHVSQPSICKQFSGNPLSTSVTADSKLSPCFHQPPTGHQWLIPVMSPSEGLIYKPYPGHGFMGPAFGSCGPPGSNPMMGNFVNPAYSVPSPHHHYQGIGVPPTSPPVGHSYFPPYGMPVINPVFSGLASQPGQSGQLSGLCNVLTAQKNGGVIPNVVRLRASKESELQGSTASSPGERALGFGVGPATNGRNALPLFPTSPSTHTLDEVPQLHDVEQPATRVIKVVPHNARSATESVARIFQSIQEERKQCDSA
ncbi:Protein EARLY FLOWERING 3 [Camellia lanceoleosa]|uniref:Protein EARLY FLOWERING 3 n=1 Tax=Camellia lanceoleosa TaxID=1840588 RepID=A0ACC0G0N0_9ERIC|nr:Protein EARLY FLOWERING 3 [Camellia lanceoleosa]